MSTYKDHYRAPREGEQGYQLALCWAEFTRRRLEWLYPGQDRTALAATDLAAWNRLGAGRDAA